MYCSEAGCRIVEMDCCYYVISLVNYGTCERMIEIFVLSPCELIRSIWMFVFLHLLLYYVCLLRVVAVDLRGYGDTDKPSGIYNYSVGYLLEDIRQIIDAFGTFFDYLVIKFSVSNLKLLISVFVV